MLLRIVRASISIFAAVALASCSGGSNSASTSKLPSNCGDPQIFCLSSCNLGCSATGCSLTDIAQNQPLVFIFSHDVDPGTVDFSTVSLKTTTGEEPVGVFVVEGSAVSFIPEARSIKGATFFGFEANAEYVLTIPGGSEAASAMVSTSGKRLDKSVTCNLRITGGIVDLDGQPPFARLIQPSTLINVSKDTLITLEFSEIIDHGPFFGVSGTSAPIQYRIRKTIRDAGGNLVCNASSQAFTLSGEPRLSNDPIRGVTTVAFTPPVALPSEACVEIEVTTRVVDLAGLHAKSQLFQFIVEKQKQVEVKVTEVFSNDLRRDPVRSGGAWTNGSATFVTLGGDGRHGDFEVTDGIDRGKGVYEFNTDNSTLSQKITSFLNGKASVSDGNYFFTRFYVPPGITASFVGSKPARIHVRGLVDIQGKVMVNGVYVPGLYDAKDSFAGQKGSYGGPFGGRGGDGAYRNDGTGNPTNPQYNDYKGYTGEDVHVPAGHAYAGSTAGTGGQGSPMHPTHGDKSQLQYKVVSGQYEATAASGGAGGGFDGPGKKGGINAAGSGFSAPPNTNPADMGAESTPGIKFDILPLPSGTSSADHFLVGGSGGGGGGSQPLFSRPPDPFGYFSGGAGSGGGGALLLRAGGSMIMSSAAKLEARGGASAVPGSALSILTLGVPAPGGGGSGGTILLQASSMIDLDGTIDVSGGAGAQMKLSGFFSADQYGGAGAPGYFRLEVPGTGQNINLFGSTIPAATLDNVGVLSDSDVEVGCMSTYYATGEIFPPDWSSYEIEAVIDGAATSTIYSDDPAKGPLAQKGISPVIFYIQGVDVDPSTLQPVPNAEHKPWRSYVGDFPGSSGLSLRADATLGFRWTILVDRSMSQDVVIKRVSVIFQK